MSDLKNQLVQSRWPDEKLEKLKKDHGPLTAIIVDGKVGLFKKPTRTILGSASAYASTDIIRYSEIIAESTFVDGDRELLDDDDYFLAILPELSLLGANKTAEVVKL